MKKQFFVTTVIALSLPALAGAQTLSPTGMAPGMAPAETAWASESAWDIPGEYVVDFKDDIDEAAIRGLLGSLGVAFEATGLFAETKIQVVRIPGAAAAVLARLRADPGVELVEPHARVQAFFVPNDPMYQHQWHLPRIGAEQAWGMSVGRGVTVAVIDTGVACETIDGFKKATDLAETRCVGGVNLVSRRKRPADDHGHGTHVAGTIAQSTHNGLGVAGIAFRARLMPVKVLSANGWGTTTAVADGIRWAADHGAQVINLSLGGPRNSAVLQRAVDHARSRGAVVVAAAGNSGGAVGYPGGSRGVIGVSATDTQDVLARFSSRGKEIDIAAPGVNVTQQTICDRGKNGCELFPAYNGTSMASPHVAGVAALLVSLGVTRPDKLEEYLKDSAKKLDGDPNGHLYGAGLLQAGQAAGAVHRTHVIVRLLSLLIMGILAVRWARRRGETSVSPAHPLFVLGAWLTGIGLLFFAPWTLSGHHLWVDLLSRPFGEWDLLVGASLHGFLPLAHVGVPLLLSVALLSVKRAAPLLAGVAVGTAGYLGSIAALGELHTPFGSVVTLAWCLLNAVGCLYLASLVMVDKTG